MGYSIFDETMVDMTWPEIEKAAGEGAIVLLPLGIIEEHGPHMGLAVDTYTAYLISVLARRELEGRGIATLIAPPYYWGISPGTSTFAGTFSVRKETMKAVTYDILASLQRWNFNRVFTVNWHADYHHCRVILEAVQEARRDTGIDACCVLTESDVRRLRLTGDEEYILTQPALPFPGMSGEYVDLHAGSLETGIMLHYFPEQVDAELAKKLKVTELTYDDLRGIGRSDEETRRLIPQGYFGDPARFDTEAARQYIEAFARSYADTIESYLNR
jgi:creatinine amidohydrolase